ncbi:MAG: c-type cytochrome [Acidimicrobiia bacterium]|nr:c-type cytochrome [Acidimicrobiia bacterium]
MSLGPVAVAIAVAFLLVGLAYLANSGRGARPGREIPPNLAPFMVDEDLENKRLNKTLTAALFSSAFLAIALPLYFLTESGRQADFVELFEEEAVHIGEDIYLEQAPDNPEGFGCIACHGAEGVGGGTDFVDPRTGATVTWAAPSLNDVLYRYTDEEVRYWLIWGRPGSPMPAWGVEAGGPLNDQQLDFVIEYLHSIQIPQEEALANVETRVNEALATLSGAEAAITTAIAEQEAELSALLSAPDRLTWADDLAGDLEVVLAGAEAGLDSDLDGLSDDVETQINRISELAFANVGTDATPATQSAADRLVLELDHKNGFSTVDVIGEGVADRDAAIALLEEIQAQATALRPLSLNNAPLVAAATDAVANLEMSLADARFAVDFDEVATAGFGGDVAAAERAYGLYAAYCARCHTAGYSAGPAGTLEPGSGALGPSLRDGRSIVQFPDAQDHYDFILNGSVNGQAYGVNGIGRGWMPGFGAVLSEADLRLIVDFERSLQ